MARMAKVFVPDIPHHVTQRGNHRQKSIFRDSDYEYYKMLLAKYVEKSGTRIWAYCLMSNHVHLIMVPQHETGLCESLAEAHRHYTRHANFRENWGIIYGMGVLHLAQWMKCIYTLQFGMLS